MNDCTATVQVIDLLMERPRSVSQLARTLGWRVQDTEALVMDLAQAGIVQRCGDQEALCSVYCPEMPLSRTDRLTEDTILLGIKRWHTIPALSQRLRLPRPLIEQTVHRAFLEGQLHCSLIGMLPVFRENQPNHPTQ